MPDEEAVQVRSLGPATVEARARGHTFVLDKLPQNGGQDRGPMASEYWLASLASCHVTTALKIAAKRKVDLQGVSIDARLWLENGFIQRVRLEVRTEGALSPEEREILFRLTERACTISKATSVPIEHAFIDNE